MGNIRNKKFANQFLEFESLRFKRGIMPTDVDAFLEFEGKAFIFIELKYKGALMPVGQSLALERLTDALGCKAILLVCDHENENDDYIDADQTTVRTYRYNGKWRIPKKPIDPKSAIELFLKKVGVSL